ncbi:MAG: hypothetical protein ACTSRS_14370 [Candidatus Helarchaeota archaeon]
MGRFNPYLWGFICCLPLGLVLIIPGYIILEGGALYSGYSMIYLGIGILILAAIFLIIGLIKYGRQTI